MKQKLSLCALIAITITIQQPLNAGTSNHSFRTVPVSRFFISHAVSLSAPSKLISFKVSMIHDKVLLQWVMGENETTDQFEIEKSTDGKNFVMAALIFGTDKPETDSYEYYDRVKKKNISYRLKIIDKNKQVAYSGILVLKIK